MASYIYSIRADHPVIWRSWIEMIMIVENVAAAAMDTEKVFSWQSGKTAIQLVNEKKTKTKKDKSMDMALSTSDKE